jgi:hypothetical protein
VVSRQRQPAQLATFVRVPTETVPGNNRPPEPTYLSPASSPWTSVTSGLFMLSVVACTGEDPANNPARMPMAAVKLKIRRTLRRYARSRGRDTPEPRTVDNP